LADDLHPREFKGGDTLRICNGAIIMSRLKLLSGALALAAIAMGSAPAMAQSYHGWGMMDGYGPGYGQGRMQRYGYEHGPGMMWGNGSGYGPGMMRGYGPHYGYDSSDRNVRHYRRGYGRGMMGPGWYDRDDE
jgi:hypothetical protein